MITRSIFNYEISGKDFQLGCRRKLKRRHKQVAVAVEMSGGMAAGNQVYTCAYHACGEGLGGGGKPKLAYQWLINGNKWRQPVLKQTTNHLAKQSKGLAHHSTVATLREALPNLSWDEALYYRVALVKLMRFTRIIIIQKYNYYTSTCLRLAVYVCTYIHV